MSCSNVFTYFVNLSRYIQKHLYGLGVKRAYVWEFRGIIHSIKLLRLSALCNVYIYNFSENVFTLVY